MFIGFNLTLKEHEIINSQYYYEKGKANFECDKNIIIEELESFINKEDGSIDGSKLQEEWFPQIKADIFISHSHEDEHLALTLAGWMREMFGLTTFIDSSVWGYSNKLLEIIDKEFSYKQSTNTYDYNARNFSTSHVHMMLTTALSKMMDRTECLFFLNTPNSNGKIRLDDTTKSPWIYAEIEISKIIQKKSSRQITNIELKRMLNEAVKRLDVNYNIDLKHLLDLNVKNLIKWKEHFYPPSFSPLFLDTSKILSKYIESGDNGLTKYRDSDRYEQPNKYTALDTLYQQCLNLS